MIRIANVLYEILGDDFGGTPSPPGSTAALDFGPGDEDRDDLRPIYVARAGNDGAELWLGFHRKWWGYYRHEDARRLAWFIIWDWWIVGTWFGLKRRVWYWALHQIVSQYPTQQNSTEEK